MPPDVVRVDYRKYDGTPHRSYPALRLGEDEHGVWLGVPQDTFSGESFKYADPYVLLVPHNAWYTAMFNAPPRRTEVYCDIATPANWPAQDRLCLVDLDLDVRRRRMTRSAELADHQERLYASAKVGASRRRVLLVLQAMDCGGKDGTTRQVAGAMNPQGLRIVGFGKPTEEERRHDFLWRIRQALPVPGYVGVFNRSHYEDVLVVRVHELVPRDVWSARYEQINQFERELAADDTTIVKVMLHISAKEQRKRLLLR